MGVQVVGKAFARALRQEFAGKHFRVLVPGLDFRVEGKAPTASWGSAA